MLDAANAAITVTVRHTPISCRKSGTVIEKNHAGTVAALETELRRFRRPQEVDARARRRQSELLARYGGREAALARGDLSHTRAPGQVPDSD